MPKILIDGEWYDQLSTEALYEAEYERLLTNHSAEIFPQFKLVRFNKTVQSEERSAKADFALIHKNYREWWVGEAELGHHSFKGHVVPQVETLSRARYGEAEAEYLHHKDSTLDLTRLKAMVKGVQPNVLVVVNVPRPEWTRELRTHGAIVTVLEVFRSRFNKYVYRLNGEQPMDAGGQFSRCTLEMARMLRLDSPGILPPSCDDPIEVVYAGGVTLWRRVETGDAVYLATAAPIRLARGEYRLLQMESGNFELSAS